MLQFTHAFHAMQTPTTTKYTKHPPKTKISILFTNIHTFIQWKKKYINENQSAKEQAHKMKENNISFN